MSAPMVELRSQCVHELPTEVNAVKCFASTRVEADKAANIASPVLARLAVSNHIQDLEEQLQEKAPQ